MMTKFSLFAPVPKSPGEEYHVIPSLPNLLKSVFELNMIFDSDGINVTLTQTNQTGTKSYFKIKFFFFVVVVAVVVVGFLFSFSR